MSPALPHACTILGGPIVPTILRLAVPNALIVLVQAAVVVIETVFVGMLGRDAMAAYGLVAFGVLRFSIWRRIGN